MGFGLIPVFSLRRSLVAYSFFLVGCVVVLLV